MRPLKLSESISDAIAIGIDKTFRNVSISITHESDPNPSFLSSPCRRLSFFSRAKLHDRGYFFQIRKSRPAKEIGRLSGAMNRQAGD